MILSHPICNKRKKGQPKEKVHVCPHDVTRHMLCGMQHVMVIVPVDSQIKKAKYVTEKHRQYWNQRGKFGRVRDLHFQHHDSDDDCENAVAECF